MFSVEQVNLLKSQGFIPEKTCTRCGETKPTVKFRKKSGVCKTCFNRVYDLRKKKTPYTPEARDFLHILLKDPCVFCGKLSGTIDHIVPRSRGGTGDLDNLAPACKTCNDAKADQTLLQFLLNN